MNRLDLTDITLQVFTSTSIRATALAIGRCLKVAEFNNILICTDQSHRRELLDNLHDQIYKYVPGEQPRIDQFVIGKEMTSSQDTSIHRLTDTPLMLSAIADFMLTVQWDGFIVNPEAWNNDFRNFDYIGATWPDGIVGNDGFSLTSRHFWENVQDLEIPPDTEHCHPGDVKLCRKYWNGVPGYRQTLDYMGTRFAPVEVADRFSVEEREYSHSFGLHGKEAIFSAMKQGLL